MNSRQPLLWGLSPDYLNSQFITRPRPYYFEFQVRHFAAVLHQPDEIEFLYTQQQQQLRQKFCYIVKVFCVLSHHLSKNQLPEAFYAFVSKKYRHWVSCEKLTDYRSCCLRQVPSWVFSIPQYPLSAETDQFMQYLIQALSNMNIIDPPSLVENILSLSMEILAKVDLKPQDASHLIVSREFLPAKHSVPLSFLGPAFRSKNELFQALQALHIDKMPLSVLSTNPPSHPTLQLNSAQSLAPSPLPLKQPVSHVSASKPLGSNATHDESHPQTRHRHKPSPILTSSAVPNLASPSKTSSLSDQSVKESARQTPRTAFSAEPSGVQSNKQKNTLPSEYRPPHYVHIPDMLNLKNFKDDQPISAKMSAMSLQYASAPIPDDLAHQLNDSFIDDNTDIDFPEDQFPIMDTRMTRQDDEQHQPDTVTDSQIHSALQAIPQGHDHGDEHEQHRASLRTVPDQKPLEDLKPISDTPSSNPNQSNSWPSMDPFHGAKAPELDYLRNEIISAQDEPVSEIMVGNFQIANMKFNTVEKKKAGCFPYPYTGIHTRLDRSITLYSEQHATDIYSLVKAPGPLPNEWPDLVDLQKNRSGDNINDSNKLLVLEPPVETTDQVTNFEYYNDEQTQQKDPTLQAARPSKPRARGKHARFLYNALTRGLLFGQLPPEVNEQLHDRMHRVQIEKSAVVIRQGQPGDFLYIVGSGTFEAWVEVNQIPESEEHLANLHKYETVVLKDDDTERVERLKLREDVSKGTPKSSSTLGDRLPPHTNETLPTTQPNNTSKPMFMKNHPSPSIITNDHTVATPRLSSMSDISIAAKSKSSPVPSPTPSVNSTSAPTPTITHIPSFVPLSSIAKSRPCMSPRLQKHTAIRSTPLPNMKSIMLKIKAADDILGNHKMSVFLIDYLFNPKLSREDRRVRIDHLIAKNFLSQDDFMPSTAQGSISLSTTKLSKMGGASSFQQINGLSDVTTDRAKKKGDAHLHVNGSLSHGFSMRPSSRTSSRKRVDSFDFSPRYGKKSHSSQSHKPHVPTYILRTTKKATGETFRTQDIIDVEALGHEASYDDLPVYGPRGLRVAVYTQGHSFGELALIQNFSRQATITCHKTGVLWALDRISFRYVTRKYEQNQQSRVLHLLREPPFSRLASDTLDHIVDSLSPVFVPQGHPVFVDGSVGSHGYIIDAGVVVITARKSHIHPKHRIDPAVVKNIPFDFIDKSPNPELISELDPNVRNTTKNADTDSSNPYNSMDSKQSSKAMLPEMDSHVVLAVLTEGELFGHLSLIENKPRDIFAWAHPYSDVHLHAIPKDCFLQYFSSVLEEFYIKACFKYGGRRFLPYLSMEKLELYGLTPKQIDDYESDLEQILRPSSYSQEETTQPSQQQPSDVPRQNHHAPTYDSFTTQLDDLIAGLNIK